LARGRRLHALCTKLIAGAVMGIQSGRPGEKGTRVMC
jgi:hypothetical protein